MFTGGIGENSVWLRTEVCRGLEVLGIYPDRNAQSSPNAHVATPDSPARIPCT